jgi:hypothetical protein
VNIGNQPRYSRDFSLYRSLAAIALSVCCSTAIANGIVVDGKPYAYTLEIKCQVAKAVPDPDSGPEWYKPSDIGKVWFKFDPSVQPTAELTKGKITIYRTDRVYKELVVYDNAFIINKSNVEYFIGGGDLDSLDLESDDKYPLAFNVDKVESQGMFYGADKRPKYLLGRCDLLDGLAKAVGTLYKDFEKNPENWAGVQWID